MERVDSNVLWALVAYVKRSSEHGDHCVKLLGPKTLEFLRKCSRFLLIYMQPIVDKTVKFGIKVRNKTN